MQLKLFQAKWLRDLLYVVGLIAQIIVTYWPDLTKQFPALGGAGWVVMAAGAYLSWRTQGGQIKAMQALQAGPPVQKR